MIGWIIFPIIFIYSILMCSLGITKVEVKEGWQDSLNDIWKIAIPVAVTEELIFRYLIQYRLLYGYLNLGWQESLLIASIFFSLTHFIWGMYRNGGEYNTAAESAFLCIGLIIFGMVCGVLFYYPYQNIIFHCLAIYAVQLLPQFFKQETSWLLYDQGHQLLRSPIIWIILWILYLA